MSKVKSVSNRVQIFCEPGSSLTLQEFKDECDILNIMKKFRRSGVVDHMNTAVALYGDFSNVPDYQTAMNVVVNAQDAFMNLPAHIRTKFRNDPGEFLDYMSSDSNFDEKVSLGLLNAPKEQVLRTTQPQVEPTLSST